MKKMFRILFSLFFIYSFVLTSATGISPRAEAQESVPDPTPMRVSADGLYCYKVYGDGSVVIEEYRGRERDIVIPDELDGNTVTAVGAEAFAYCKMRSLTIPDGINVSGRAFEYAEISDALTLPAGVRISIRAFEYAELPDAVVIPEDAVLEGDCFSYCEDLETLFVAPGGVLKGEVFSYSEDLKAVICAPGSSIEDEAFYDCERLKTVVLCGDVTLGDKAFSYCSRAVFINADASDYDRNLEQFFPAAVTAGIPAEAPSEPSPKGTERTPVNIEGKLPKKA